MYYIICTRILDAYVCVHYMYTYIHINIYVVLVSLALCLSAAAFSGCSGVSGTDEATLNWCGGADSNDVSLITDKHPQRSRQRNERTNIETRGHQHAVGGHEL